MVKVKATCTVLALLAASTAQAKQSGLYLLPSEPAAPALVALLALLFCSVILLWRSHAKNKELQHSITTFRNTLDERTRMLDELQASKASYKNLYNLASAGIFRTSLDGLRFYAANNAMARLLGYSSSLELISQAIPLELYDDTDTRESILSKLIRGISIINHPIILKRKDGTYLNVLITATISEDQKHVEGTLVDITRLSQAEHQIKENRDFLQSVIDAMPIAVFFKDKSGEYQLVNNEFANLLGASKEATIGKTVHNFLSSEYSLEHERFDQELLDADGPASQRFEYPISKDGQIIDALFYKETVLNLEGKVTGLVGIIIDITQRKQREKMLKENQALLSSLINSIPDLIFFKDTHSNYLGCNDAFAAHLGLEAEDIVALSDYDLYPQGLAEHYIQWDKKVLTDMKAHKEVIPLPFADTKTIIEVIKTPITIADSESEEQVVGVVGVARDMTEQQQLEEQLRQAKERYQSIFETSVEGIFTSTLTGKYIEVNLAMATMFGYSHPEHMVHSVHNVAEDHWARSEQRQEMLELLKNNNGRLSGYEIEARKRDGDTMWISLSVRIIKDQDGNDDLLEGICADITEKKLTQMELALRASTDALTGLSNRANFEQSMERMFTLARRSDTQIGILFIDLDGFKPVNDKYGHDIGDKVLQEVAERIKHRLRKTDVAARLGGDEFTILLWDVSGTEGTYRIGRELLSAIGAPYYIGTDVVRIGASIGGAISPSNGTTPTDVLRAADMAMYGVKRQGKNGLRMARETIAC